MTRICFVCLGNICRSPLAEAIFKQLAQAANLGEQFHIESAGTGSWHVGELPHANSRQVAQTHGLELTSRAQQFRGLDFERFDYILALADDIRAELEWLAPSAVDRAKIKLLRPYDPQAGGSLDVPDPYYGTIHDYERVYQMIDRACRELLTEMAQSVKS